MTAMSTVIGNSQAAIFGRLIASDQEDLPPDLAQYLLRLSFPRQDRERVNELAAKARAGSLSVEERDELERYNLAGDVLALWQSKARRSLAHP
jgi:hypothetical protein